MRRRHEISDQDWERIEALLPGKAADPGVTAEDNRRFVNAVFWIARTGAPWRDLPERLGNWNSVFQRFNRSREAGGLGADHADARCQRGLGMAAAGFHHRAGPPACGRKKRGQHDQALGRSRGGFSTKVPVTVDALGNPVRLRLTPGQVSDISQAEALLEGLDFQAAIAGKGYDSDRVVAAITGQSAQAAIPPKKNRKVQRWYDTHLDTVRNLVERFFNRVKLFRRVATRYEKTDRNDLAFWQFASMTVLLR